MSSVKLLEEVRVGVFDRKTSLVPVGFALQWCVSFYTNADAANQTGDGSGGGGMPSEGVAA